jgi:UTP--glucose-1-phosphate uridylyltransferase
MNGLDASVEKMRGEGLSDAAVGAFAHYYRRLAEGEQGMLPESELEPVEDVQDAAELPDDEDGAAEALNRTVVIKLNGGLGTSMGMTRAKSLLEVKDGHTFLDLIARQVLALRQRFPARLPLLLMNSFRTRDDSLGALARYPNIEVDLPLDFIQGKVPKLLAGELEPVSWPDDPEHEWTPPGHGDIYTSLAGSGMLERLLDAGYEYAFISNSDNLGAVVEPRVLAWFAREEAPFAMEVCTRTEADKKGGHIARRREDGGLVLRETAQTPDEDLPAFEDTERHPYFNTNNLWVSLPALRAVLDEREGVLGLPMIVNRKTVDPTDSSSPEVFQLESAMGAAIGEFEGAAAVLVPRGRFVPVKKTSDLLVVRSDAYDLTDDWRIELADERGGQIPLVDLDDHFKLLADFEERFEHGPPSLRGADRLSVSGDVAFGRDVTVRGSVSIEHEGEDRLVIEHGTVLEGVSSRA